MSENKKVQCSFCGKKIDKEKIKTEEELVFLGTDPGTVICKNCVDACVDIMKDTKPKAVKQDMSDITPKKIKSQQLEKTTYGENRLNLGYNLIDINKITNKELILKDTMLSKALLIKKLKIQKMKK